MELLKNRRNQLILAALVFSALFLAFYPKFYYFTDEQQYLRNAYLLANGTPKVGELPHSYGYTEWKGGFVSKYPIGESLLLIPFTLLDWRLSFLCGLLLHLLGFAVFALVLRRMGLDEGYALLFLLFPAFVISSRTLMSEGASILFILLGFYFWLGDRHYLAGAGFGISLLMRVTNAIVFVPFLLLSLGDRKKFVKMLAPFALFALLSVAYNYLVFGELLLTPYSALDSGNMWVPETFLFKFAMYAAVLCAIYPLMLPGIFTYRGKGKTEITAAVFLLLLFYSIYWLQPFRGNFSNIYLGTRYMMPVIPLLMVAYAENLGRIAGRIRPNLRAAAAAFAVLLMFAGAVAATCLHNSLTDERYGILQEIYSRTGDKDLIVSDYSGTGEAYLSHDSGYNAMFFTEFFGNRNVVPLYYAREYIAGGGFEKVYYYKTFFEGSRLRLELREFDGNVG